MLVAKNLGREILIEQENECGRRLLGRILMNQVTAIERTSGIGKVVIHFQSGFLVVDKLED